MGKKWIGCCVLFCLLAVTATAQDRQVFIPRADQPVQLLTAYLQAAADRDKTFSIAKLLQQEDTGLFLPLPAVRTIDVHNQWWLKLTILPSFSSDSFYIGLPPQQMPGNLQGNDVADVWIVRNKQVVASYLTGTLTPASKRPVAIPVNHNLFPVSLKEQEPLVIYWRIRRTINFEPVQFNFALQHNSVIRPGATSFDRMAWFYTGLMFILFIFGLVFFIITRERPFIWFTCIAASLCLHMQLLNPENLLTQWLFPEHPILQYPVFVFLVVSFFLLVLQFPRSFVHTRQTLPVLDKAIRGIMIYVALVGVLNLVLLAVNPATNISILFFLLGFAGSIGIGIRLIVAKDLYTKWTGFALCWLFFFQVLGFLGNMQLLPAWFPNPWVIAQEGMMILLFFALAYRFKQSAKEKAEAAKILEMDAIKSRFFANISHEFRTPLTLMLGPLKQMEENGMEEGLQKKYISMMRRNGDRLMLLINQLLDLSKLESGKMELALAKTDVTGLLKAIVASFDSLAEQNQVNYHIHFPEENIIGFIDRDKLEKIVVNLLSNAFRFTAANGTVSFSVEHDEKRLRFTVHDNGVGMPREQLDKIFDRFHQVAGTEGGTGIGLSLVKELLQLHKGQVSVQSETGKGSSFRVSIPIAAELYAPAEIVTTNGIAASPATIAATTTTVLTEDEPTQEDPSLPLVLVVEDNVDLQQFIGDTLQPHFRIQVAANGNIGWEKALELVPDCIVSDVMMPGINGMELCSKLKKEPATSHVPVVLLTAKAGSTSKMEGLQTGADDYVVKPFDGPELIVRIQNLIEQRKQLRELYSKQVISVQPEELDVQSTEQTFIQQVRQAVDDNIDNELFGVAELANTVFLSRSQLHRKLKALTGQSPNELVRNYRLERAFQLLQQRSGTITDIAFQTGFSSPAYFSKCFSDRYGYAPGKLLANK